MFDAKLTGLEDLFSELRRATDDALDGAFATEGQRVAAQARGDHPFSNRTGELEDSIVAADVGGRASDGTLVGGVSALADHASYVEDKPQFEFLLRAYDATASEFERDVNEALTEAARRAGMRGR